MKEFLMKHGQDLIFAFVIMFCVGSCTYLEAEEPDFYLYTGGWSYHAPGVKYDTQVHETIGIEYDDWTIWKFTNSNLDPAYFVGQSVEIVQGNTFSYGATFGCIGGYTKRCLPMVFQKVSADWWWGGVDVNILPNVVYKATLRWNLGAIHPLEAPDRSDRGKWSVGYTVGTTGIGGRVAYRVNDSFSISLEHSEYGVDIDNGSGDVEFTGLYADWRPFDSGFFLGLGLVHNKSRGHYEKELTKTFTFGDHATTLTGRAEADLSFPEFTQYVGLGYEYFPRHANNLGYRVDLGLVLTGKPVIESRGQVDGYPELDKVSNAFAERVVEDFSEDFDISSWPVAKVSVNFHF